MFFLVVLQIAPQLIGQRVLVQHSSGLVIEVLVTIGFNIWLVLVPMEDFTQQVRPFGRQIDHSPVEDDRIAKAHDEDPLPVLGHEMRTVDHLAMNLITQFLTERSLNHIERAAFVVGLKVLDVLQQERLGALLINDAGHVKEQGALRFVLEAVGTPERIFFGNACNRERLTRETAQQDIVIWYLVGVDQGDVTVDRMALRVVHCVGLLGIDIPFAGKDALATNGFECLAYAANPGEQVNEPEVSSAECRPIEIQQPLKLLHYQQGRRRVARPPSP